MAYDATVNTDFPVLTTEDEVSRLADMYRQEHEARSGSSTPPSAALTPTPTSDYSGADEIGPPASAPTPAPPPGAGEDISTPTPTPAPAAPAGGGGKSLRGGNYVGTPTSPTGAAPAETKEEPATSLRGGKYIGEPISLGSAPAEKEAGWMDIASRGGLRLFEDAKQSAEVAQGKTPTKSKTPEADYEKPIELGDYLHPVQLAEKLVFATTRSGAQIPAGMIGAIGGGAIGSAVAPGIGTAIGGVAGGAGLMGLVAGLQELGPAMVAELDKTPDDPNGASDRAINAAIKSGLITTASMAVFGGATPFKQLIKGAFTDAAATRAAAAGGTAAEKAVAEAAAQKTMKEAAPGFVEAVGTQLVGQPAVVAGGTAAGNIVEGKPVGEGVVESIPGSLANVAIAGVTHGASAARERVFRGRAEETPPAERPPGERPPPGEEYGPPEPYGPPTPPAPSEPYGPPAPPPAPPELGPSRIQQRYGNQPPPEISPAAPPTDQSVIQQRYGAPRGAVEQGPAAATEDPAIRAATDAAVNVPEVAPAEAAPPVARARSRIQERYGNEPAEPPPPLPVAEPTTARSRLQERVGTGRDTTVPPPDITPDITPDIIPRDNIGQVPEKSLTPPRDTTTDVTIEGDHLDPSRSVAKNPAGEVIGKGATPEEARADAQARGHTPYAEEAAPRAPRILESESALPKEKVNEPAAATTEAAAPKSVMQYVDDYIAGKGRDSPAHEQFAANNASAIEAEFQRRAAGEPAAATKARATSKAKAAAPVTKPAAAEAAAVSKAKATAPVAEAKPASTKGLNQIVDEIGALIKQRTTLRSQISRAENAGRQVPSELTARRDAVQGQIETLQKEMNAYRPAAREPAAATEARAKSKAKAEAAPAPVAEAKPAPERLTPEADETQIAGHFNEWLNRRVAEDERPTVRRQIGALLQEHPELLSQGKSWPELRTLAETLAERRAAPKPGRVSMMARDVKGDIEEAQQRRGPEPTRGTPVEEIGEGEAEGITAREGGIAEARAKTTTDTDLKYNDLLHDVLQGDKTIDQAAAAAGTKEPGTRGRPRRNPNMAAHLDQVIKRAQEHNKGDQALFERATTILENKKLTAAQKNKAIVKINDQMDARVAARGPRQELERDRLSEVIKHRDQLRGGRTDELNAPPTYEEAPLLAEKHVKTITQFVRNVRTAEASSSLNQRLRTSHNNGTTDSIHDYLNDIVNDPAIKLFAPHYVELAKRYLELAPDYVDVGSYEVIGGKIGRPDLAVEKANSGASATYFPSSNSIGLSRSSRGTIQDVLHETTHAITHPYLEHIYKKVERGEDLTPREQKHYDAAEAIHGEMESILGAIDEAPRLAAEHFNLDYAVNAAGNEYVASRRHEVMSMVMANPEVEAFLARTAPSAEFKAEMKRLGYGEPATVWQGFKAFLKDILGFKKGNSALDLLLDPITDITETGAKYRRAVDRGLDYNPDAPMQRGTSRDGVRGRVPTDLLPSEWARDKMRSFGEAAVDSQLFDTTREKVSEKASGLGPAIARVGAKVALPISPTSMIARYNADVLPAGLKIRDAWARTERVARDFYKEGGDKVQNMVRQLKYGRDVAGLMNDATLAKVHLGNDINNFEARNAHLNNDEMQKAYDLRDRFNNLTPEKQQLYQDVRDHYRELNTKMRALEYEHAARHALPDATDAQITALGEKLKTQRGIKEVLDNPDVMSQAFGERWENSRALVHEIAKLQNEGWVRGDYFPLRRYGEYVVRYGEPGTAHYGVEMFERSNEAKARQAELAKEFEGTGVHVTDVLSKAANPNPKGFLPDSVFSGLERALIKRGAGEEEISRAKEAWAQVMLQRAVNTERAQSRARRNYVEGANSDNAGATLWNDFLSAGQRIGHLTHGVAETQAFQEGRRQVSAIEAASGTTGSAAEIIRSAAQLADLKARPGVSAADLAHAQQQHDWLVKPPTSQEAIRARETFQHLESRRVPDGDRSRNFLGTGAGYFTKASFVYHLARPAKLALDVLEAHANGQSILGAKYGHGQAGIAIAKAMRDLAPTGMSRGFRNMVDSFQGEMEHSKWYMSDALRDRAAASRPGDTAHAAEMKALFDQANDYGVIDSTFTRELQRQSGAGAFDFGSPTGGGLAEKLGLPRWTNVPSNMMNLFAAGEHTVDSTMRATLLKAGYDLARRSGASEVDARRAAIDYTMEAIPVFGAWNSPRIASPRGPLGAMAPAMLQYKMYGMQMYAMMASKVRQAIARPEERGEALKALAGLVATHSLLAGATATMFGVPVVAALGAWDLFQGKDKPHNYETDFRRWITDITNPTVGKFASGGLVGLAGGAQQQTMKLSNMTNVPELRSFDKGGVGQWILQAMTGAAPDVATQLFDAVRNLTSGNWGKAFEEGVPRVFSDPYKAYKLATEGVTNARGQTIMPASQIPMGQVIAKGFGFNPESTTTFRAQRTAAEDFKHEVNYARQKAMDQYVNSGGRDMSGVRAYLANTEYRQFSPITMQHLREDLARERKRETRPELHGMLPSKKQTPKLLQEMRFQ